MQMLHKLNWKFGRQEIDVLIAAIAFGDCCLPLCQSLLQTCGNFNHNQMQQNHSAIAGLLSQ